MWTHFWDMHSGGGQKLEWANIYIEAEEEEAKRIFYSRFERNPDRVTCTCCGPDYSIYSEKTLGQLTAFHRKCLYNKTLEQYVEKQDPIYSQEYITLANYRKDDNVLIIKAGDIQSHERTGAVPEEGYVWQ